MSRSIARGVSAQVQDEVPILRPGLKICQIYETNSGHVPYAPHFLASSVNV